MIDLSAIKTFLIQIIQPIVDDSINRALQQHKIHQKSDDEKLMNAQELADYLGLAKQTVYEKSSRGELPKIKKGKNLLFRPSDVRKWLNEGRYKTKYEIEAEAEEIIKKKGGIL